jgi:hypothetical protein
MKYCCHVLLAALLVSSFIMVGCDDENDDVRTYRTRHPHDRQYDDDRYEQRYEDDDLPDRQWDDDYDDDDDDDDEGEWDDGEWEEDD